MLAVMFLVFKFGRLFLQLINYLRMSEIEKMCDRWIVEYGCWQMWNEFSRSGTVDDVHRTLYEWRNYHPENFGDGKTHGFRLLIQFMCKIAEAASEMSAELPASGKTTLEEAIDLLGYISDAFIRQDLREVELCLKRYAVLSPLHNSDRKTAEVNQFMFAF